MEERAFRGALHQLQEVGSQFTRDRGSRPALRELAARSAVALPPVHPAALNAACYEQGTPSPPHGMAKVILSPPSAEPDSQAPSARACLLPRLVHAPPPAPPIPAPPRASTAAVVEWLCFPETWDAASLGPASNATSAQQHARELGGHSHNLLDTPWNDAQLPQLPFGLLFE